jgi:transposase
MNGKRVIGVDIGKRWLDAAWEGSVRVERYANDAAAITRLIEKLDPAQDIVVFERCGGWERNLEAALAEKAICWAVVHSQRVKAFREVQGVKAKTDAIDARLLRAYGRDRLDAGELRLGRREDVTLDALMARQRQLKSMLHAENCRLATAAIEPARASIERVIALVEGELVGSECSHIDPGPTTIAMLGRRDRSAAALTCSTDLPTVRACSALLPAICHATDKVALHGLHRGEEHRQRRRGCCLSDPRPPGLRRPSS